jgi:hypothetical protein
MNRDAQIITAPIAGGTAASPMRLAAIDRRAWQLMLVAAFAFGTWLRCTQLPVQILVDDEWHAIHALLHLDVAQILTNFGTADYSIPLTLYDRFLAFHAGGLTEWRMHVPMLAAGVALLAIAPWMLRDTIRLPEAAAWVALLAVSPLAMYLSRTARPYAITCLLSFVAVIAFRKWWQRAPRAPAFAALYVVATFAAGWLHLVTLAFTLLPFAWCALRAVREANARRSLSRLVALGIVAALPLAIALVPPLVNASAQLGEKTGVDAVSVESAYRTLLMMAGTPWPLCLAAMLVLAALGAARLHRRDADFTGDALALMVVPAVAVALVRPAWIQHPGVYARYLLPALPFALLFVAEGAVALTERWRPAPLASLAPLAIAFATAVLFVTGPIPGWLYTPNQFIGHARFQFDYDPAHNPYVQQIPKAPMPAFYRQLAKLPAASITLIEAPWRLESNFDPLPWYQQVHRQYVKIGLVTPMCGVRDFGEYPPRTHQLRFRFFVHLADVLDGDTSGARYLVMHRKAWKTPPDAVVDWPDLDACLPRIERALGAPVYRDDDLVVFDLAQPRAG